MFQILEINTGSDLSQAFFWTFAKKLKVKKTKTQAQKTPNSRMFGPKLKIPAFFQKF